METMDFARSHDIHENAIRLELQVTFGVERDVLTLVRVDKRQLSEFAVEQPRYSLHNLSKRGFLDKHRIENAVTRVCHRILADSSTREWSITNIHGEVNREGVRKMTPREWARLQGFPDSFKIVVADASAYKQFGNSVAIPAIKATAKQELSLMGLI